MKRLYKIMVPMVIVGLFLFQLPFTSHASSTVVQKQVTYANTITYPGAVTAGNTLVVAASCFSTTDTVAVSDNQGNSWTNVAHIQQNSGTASFGFAVAGAVFVAKANGNNTPTVTISGCTGNDEGGSVYEYSGLTGAVDVVQTGLAGLGPQTSSPSCTSMTTTVTDVVLCFIAKEDAGGTWSTGTGGFTFEGGSSDHTDGYADLLDAAPGSYAGGITNSVSESWITIQVALKETAPTHAGVTTNKAGVYVKQSGVYVN